MKKKILNILAPAIIASGGYWGWCRYIGPIHIALTNFISYQVSNIALSNKGEFTEFGEVPLDKLETLRKYDFALVQGMGLKISNEQHNQLVAATNRVPFHNFAVTNPDNDISSLSETELKKVAAYLESGNKNNYQDLARYIRKYIDEKRFAPEPGAPIELKENIFFHLDDERSFGDLKSYEVYIREHHYYREEAPRIAIVAGLHGPFAGGKEHLNGIINTLQNEGLNVYPFTAQNKHIELLETINPDAVTYFPHGQMMMGQPESFISRVKAHNVSLLTGLSVLAVKEDQEKDPMGMPGSFIGQTIVMPELDGALYPHVIIVQEQNKGDYYSLDIVRNRVEKFAKIVHNSMTLKHKANADKKVAIVYFRGVGLTPATAQGLEVEASLFCFSHQLKEQGYNVGTLPPTPEAFNQQLISHTNTYRASVKGDIEKFIASGAPALVGANRLNRWLKIALPQCLYREALAKNGALPGEYLSITRDGKVYSVVAQLTSGNVTILPQPPAAISTEDDFKVLRGVKEIPPYAYMGAYPWVQNKLKADALTHFGTRGSLEFIPSKQVALSDYDWGDISVGTIPHFYYHTIGNIGGVMMAKRRSYGSITSYLTLAFTEGNMRNTFNQLGNTIPSYEKAKNPSDKQTIGLHIKKLAVQMGLHRDLRLDSTVSKPYTEEEIERLVNFAEETATEEINGELYVAGVPYTVDKISSTILAMSVDPIAYSIVTIDKYEGKVTEKDLKRKIFFTEEYLNPVKNLVKQLLVGKPVTTGLVCSYAHVTPETLAKAEEAMATEEGKGMPYFLQQRMQKEAAKQAGTATNTASTIMVSITTNTAKKPDTVGRPTKIRAPTKKPDRKPLTQQELAEIVAKRVRIDYARAIVEAERTI